MEIILPKQSIPFDDIIGKPVFFLAGPIRGGGDWQTQVCLELQKINDDIVIACPCRWDDSHQLAKYFVKDDQTHFEDQNEWERLYLKFAGLSEFYPGQRGCVIFWLGLEDKNNPHPGPEPYAMETRGEISEWRMRMKFQNGRVVIGAHKDFLGLSPIQRNYDREMGHRFHIHGTMEEVAQDAMKLYSR